MPCNIQEALKRLLGQNVAVTTPADRFMGTLASADDNVVILCNDNGVVYIRPSEVVAVATNGNGNGHNHRRD